MGRLCVNLTGQRFGRWTALERDYLAPSGPGIAVRWLCSCDCGIERSVFSFSLRSGKSVSCGCEWSERLVKRNTTHGMYGTKAYENYISAKKRAAKLRALPRWADEDKIKQIYAECPTGLEVDHIVPLQGRSVCGLHVENNLRYLPPLDNARKRNKFVGEWIKA